MSQYLGIDIGTTRTKVGCVDVEAGGLVALRSARTPVDDDERGGTRDATALMAVVSDLLVEIWDDPAVDRERVAGLSVGSVGEEVVLLDASGSVVGPVLAWHASHGREAKAGLPRGPWDRLDDTFSVFKLAWLARELPEQLASAVTFTGIADFVAHSLTGGSADEVFLNLSHSSRTGLLDLEVLGLRDDLLPALGAGHLRLPRLVPSGTVVGATAGVVGVPEGLPVVTGGHDHWCGAYGAGVRTAGDVYISAGTSEAQVMLVDELPDVIPDGIDVGAFVSGGLRYLHRATPSGRFYQSWHDMLYRDIDDDTMWSEVGAEVADAVPATVLGRSIQLAPLPLDATRGQAMAGLLAGLAVEAESTTHRLEQIAGRPAGEVVVAGVPVGQAVWRGLRQAVTSRPLQFVSEPEATVVGVALLAQLGVEGTSAALIAPTEWSTTP